MQQVSLVVFGLLVVNLVRGDLYLHNPRGSNNRLNEASKARANANRLFDSQVSMKNIFLRYFCQLIVMNLHELIIYI